MRWLRYGGVLLAIILLLSTAAANVQAQGPNSATNSPPGSPQAASQPPYPKAPAGSNVGYYDMSLGQGGAYQLAPITAAGQTGVSLADVAAANLVGIQVLFVMNPSNSGFGAEYTAALAFIQAAVNNGMVLVIHDRTVTAANTILPGGSGITFVREIASGETANIDLQDTSTILTAGLTNTSLDGGNFSNHGYATKSTLPAGFRAFMGRTDASQVVTFAYAFGQGCVIYSTIPLDFYLQGSGNNPPRDAMNNPYAPNVIRFAVAGCGRASPEPRVVVPTEVPEANTMLLLSGGIGGLATWLGWQWRKARRR